MSDRKLKNPLAVPTHSVTQEGEHLSKKRRRLPFVQYFARALSRVHNIEGGGTFKPFIIRESRASARVCGEPSPPRD